MSKIWFKTRFLMWWIRKVVCCWFSEMLNLSSLLGFNCLRNNVCLALKHSKESQFEVLFLSATEMGYFCEKKLFGNRNWIPPELHSSVLNFRNANSCWCGMMIENFTRFQKWICITVYFWILWEMPSALKKLCVKVPVHMYFLSAKYSHFFALLSKL